MKVAFEILCHFLMHLEISYKCSTHLNSVLVFYGTVFSLKRGTMVQHHAVCQIHHAEQNEFRTKNHHIGHNVRVVWEKDFPWHVPVYNTAGTTVVGLLCLICKRHNTRPVLFTSDAPTL